jgi:hypothetical protein
MQIFKCHFCKKEVLCDSGVQLKIEDGMFVVQGKYIEIGNDDFGIGANVDEDADEGATAEGTDSKKKRVVDIVHHNSLQETTFDKAAYTAYIKGYLKNMVAKIKETVAGDEAKQAEAVKEFQSNAQAFLKKVLSSFDEWQFFYPDMGDDPDYEAAMVILCKWEGETPFFYYFKDGLKGERV